jgi:hypothetical protein
MKWVIVFYMLAGGQIPPGQFIVDGPAFSSRQACELGITKLQLPEKPPPYCVKLGEQ